MKEWALIVVIGALIFLIGMWEILR